jgi:hypothetical protein
VTFGAVTPGRHVLYSATRILRRLRRSGGAPERYDQARRGVKNAKTRPRDQPAKTSRPINTVRTGRSADTLTTVNGSSSHTTRSACEPGSSAPFLPS